MKLTGNDRVHVHVLDMGDTSAVQAFARGYVASGQPLHVLFNNAGCLLQEKKVGKSQSKERKRRADWSCFH